MQTGWMTWEPGKAENSCRMEGSRRREVERAGCWLAGWLAGWIWPALWLTGEGEVHRLQQQRRVPGGRGLRHDARRSQAQAAQVNIDGV